MGKFGVCFLVLVVLFSVIQEGTSLKCYNCRSAIYGPCGSEHGVNSKNLRTIKCAENEKFCGTLVINQLRNNTIIRDCFRGSNCDVYGGNSSGVRCYACKDNKCNSSMGLMPSVLVGIFAVGFSMFFSNRKMSA